jgi:hypothetical protein
MMTDGVLGRRFGTWAENLLKETAAQHPREAVQGQAAYSLGVYHRSGAQPWGEKLDEGEQARRFAEAARYFTAVIKTYAEVRPSDDRAKPADKAAAELIRIRNVPYLKVGKQAPEVIGEDLDGRAFKLSDYRGEGGAAGLLGALVRALLGHVSPRGVAREEARRQALRPPRC